MKKKVPKGLAAVAIAAILIPTMVFANEKNDLVSPLGVGKWDVLLNSEYGVYASRWVATRPVNSGGGDLRICMSGVNTGNTITVDVFEEDLNFNDTVKTGITFKGPSTGTGTSSKTCSANMDVEKYVDGDFAEIFLKMKGKLESDTVRVYIED